MRANSSSRKVLRVGASSRIPLEASLNPKRVEASVFAFRNLRISATAADGGMAERSLRKPAKERLAAVGSACWRRAEQAARSRSTVSTLTGVAAGSGCGAMGCANGERLGWRLVRHNARTVVRTSALAASAISPLVG